MLSWHRSELPSDLVERLRRCNDRYDDAKLPFENNDIEWLHEGQVLLTEVRAALGRDYEVVVTEPWWGEEPKRIAVIRALARSRRIGQSGARPRQIGFSAGVFGSTSQGCSGKWSRLWRLARFRS